ncbi:uncharacterized protein LOC127786887 isoform X3 [Diospyros lotus]|uniref:uncharacterized protein LOC127786887 isoform X3 n=1 Tax=Diospyros lotus TaxID=55363 RepID=UPI002259021E|nr:uncharacterized protein LOC127786887 isoform X3 [Diospyros lotus]
MEIAEQRQEKDVQEMEKTELQQQQWRQEEEDETAVALQERWSWQPSAIVVNSTGGVNVLFPLSEEPHNHNGFKKHGQEALQDGDKDGNGMEEDSKAISGKNVYYDKDQGIWKCRNCCWMYQSGSPWTGHTPHPKFWHLHMLLNTKIINQEGQCFFCKFEGTESVDGFSATENNGLLFSASERSSRDDGLVAATENFDDQESQSHAINHQTKEISNDGSFSHVGFLPSGKSEISNGGSFSHLGFLPSGKSEISNDGSFSHVGFLPSAKSEISNDGSFSHVGFLPSGKSEISNGGSFSHLGLLPSEKSSEKHKTNKSCSDITVTFDDEQTVEIDRELTEFDVERVLEKQNTHDLYCPKCNSCITGRVILHKRKRSIRIPEEDKKRNKGQPLGASQLDASIAPAQNYQGHNTVDNSLDGSLIPEANGHHSGQEPEVFRCFSCFSFFIPPGSEFKLFKKLGDKSEKENIQSPRPISEVKKNWFSRLFSSHAETVLVAQGSDHMADVGKSSVEASEKVTERGLDGTDSILLLSKPASVLGESDISENVDILADLSENGQNVDASPSTKPLVEYQNTEVKISHNGSGHMADVEKSSVEASEKVTERDTAGILLQQKALGHILKPVKNATFEHNQEGLRILVHSSTDSLVVEESHMGEKLNVAIKSKPAGSGFKLFKKLWDKSEKENIQSPRPISEVKKNWFSHLFSSHAETVLVAQGSGHMADVENSSVEASKKEIKSPHQSFDGQGVMKVSGEPQRGGDDKTEEKLDHVTERGTEGAVLDPADLGTVYELDMSNSPDEIQQDNGSDNPATQLAGKDSLTVGKSHMDEKLNVAIKSKPADGTDSILLLSKPASVLGESDISEKVDILADPSTKPVVEYQNTEVKISRNANYSEASQHATIGTNMSIHIEEPLKADSNSLVLSIQDDLLLQDSQVNSANYLKSMSPKSSPGTDAIIAVQERPVEPAAAQGVQDIIPSAKTKPFPHRESAEARGFHGMDIIKSIVYGGLVESITSIGVVLSAAGADATTLNILALGLANLIGGLFVIGHNLWELKNDHSGSSISTETAEDASDQTSKQRDRYQELLGQRGKFSLHAPFAILSYLIFGLLPPVIYGFSFRESDNRDFKLIAVAASSLLCIILLATGKAYTQRPPRSYIKTVMYYVVAGFMASGVSYAVGDLIKELLEKLGWLSSDSALALTIPLQQQAWGDYRDH